MTPRLSLEALKAAIAGRLVVSCQALPGEPLYGSHVMAMMAVAAEKAGASAIRANSPGDIAAIRSVTQLPIIGLYKVDVPSFDVYITPNLQSSLDVARAGADIIALDATLRNHPEGTTAEFLQAVQNATGLPVLADISTFDEGIAAAEAGAEMVSTTMSGYTPYSRMESGPDVELVRQLSAALTIPVIAEGRISSPAEARRMLDAGAFSVVVGGAITRPQQIAAKFVAALAKQPRHE